MVTTLRVALALTATLACLSSVSAQAAGKPPGFVTGVFAGQPDRSGVIPNANKVPGTQDNNIDIAFPQAVLTHGLTYAYTVSSQNFGFKGTCTTSYALTQVVSGTETTLDSGTLASFSCAPGNIFFFFGYGHPVPDSPGAATLVGTVAFGAKKVSMKLPVFIQ